MNNYEFWEKYNKFIKGEIGRLCRTKKELYMLFHTTVLLIKQLIHLKIFLVLMQIFYDINQHLQLKMICKKMKTIN